MNDDSIHVSAGTSHDPRRIVVVGPCASGKTSLVAALEARGYEARVSGQEHSAVRGLWRRSRPDVLIALDVDLENLRRRRSPTWSATIYEAQRERLRDAFAVADLHIDTGEHAMDDVLAIVLDWLKSGRD